MWINIPDDKDIGKLLAQLHNAGVNELAANIECRLVEQKDPLHQAYRNAVPDLGDGDLECDDGAVVSLGEDPGAYVMCWKWVSSELLPEEIRLKEG